MVPARTALRSQFLGSGRLRKLLLGPFVALLPAFFTFGFFPGRLWWLFGLVEWRIWRWRPVGMAGVLVEAIFKLIETFFKKLLLL